jgi:ketosteroid isomerase-like protein
MKTLLMMTIPAALLASAIPAAAQMDLFAARESLRAADHAASAAAETRGLAEGLMPHLADSADVLIPGAVLVRGRESAATALRTSPFAETRLKLAPVRIDVSADGRSGYTYGGATRFAADSSSPARYIAYWIREGVEWKIAAFHYNLSPEPVTPPPAGFFPEPAATGISHVEADVAAALRQIMQADRDFAALAAAQNPGVAFATFAAPDGALLGGEYGPEAIRAAFAGGGGTLEWGPVAGAMAATGDLGYTVGTAVRRGADGRVGYTKYLTVWRRQPNGAWRWVVDGGNPRPADPSPGGA